MLVLAAAFFLPQIKKHLFHKHNTFGNDLKTMLSRTKLCLLASLVKLCKERNRVVWDWCAWCIMKHCSWVPKSLAEVKWRWERWLHACSCQKLDIQCRLLTAGQVNSLKVWTLYKNIGASCDCVIGLDTQIRLFLNTEEFLVWCGFHYKGKEVLGRIYEWFFCLHWGAHAYSIWKHILEISFFLYVPFLSLPGHSSFSYKLPVPFLIGI